MQDQTTKILWISDIHIKEDMFIEYNFESYFDKMIQIIHEKNPVLEYIIISGDIAFSGKIEEYNLFNKYFIEKIKNKYPNIIILSIPGNHDIMRDHLSPTDENYFTNNYDSRNNFISDQNEKSFENYVKFFRENILSTFDNKQDISHTFKDINGPMTYGYVIDKKKKFCFILINSAWLSFGQGLVNAFVSNKEIFKYDKSIKDNLKTILGNITNFPEFGSQMIGFRFIEKLKLLNNVFDNFNTHTIITVMHHPQNWLHYEEQYGENENKHNKKPLNQLKEHSHIFLTGHEHIPHFANKITDNDPIHIKGGCLIDDYITPCDEQENNRFSILEVIRNEGASFVKNIDYGIKIDTKSDGNHETNIEPINENVNPIYLKKKVHFLKKEVDSDIKDKFKSLFKNIDFSKSIKNKEFIEYFKDNKCISSIIGFNEFIEIKNKEIICDFIKTNYDCVKIDIIIYLTDDDFGYKEKISKENNIEEKIRIINETFDKYKIKKENHFNKYKHLILKEFFNNNEINNFNKISIKFHLEKRVKIF
jgi:hypothetical protein